MTVSGTAGGYLDIKANQGAAQATATNSGLIQADDWRLMNGPLGLAGARCMASLFFVTGSKLDKPRRELALELARDLIAAHSLSATAGATSPNPQVVVVRCLAPVVEPAMVLLRQIWGAWRAQLWQCSQVNPRLWAT